MADLVIDDINYSVDSGKSDFGCSAMWSCPLCHAFGRIVVSRGTEQEARQIAYDKVRRHHIDTHAAKPSGSSSRQRLMHRIRRPSLWLSGQSGYRDKELVFARLALPIVICRDHFCVRLGRAVAATFYVVSEPFEV
jgi:hypothetical protein